MGHDESSRYEVLIGAAIEEPHVDFKRAMSWGREHECERFEILTDIAAMSTYGGGFIIIGRNDDDKRSGSLSDEQIATFEPTKVNEFIKAYLRPIQAVRVVPVDYDGARLVVLDVPAFTETPPCFQQPSQCNNSGHRGDRRHFSRGDIYTRTTASQTTKVADPEDWRVVWRQIERNIRQSVTFGVSAESPDIDLYAEEREEDDRNFRLAWGVPNTTSVIHVTLKPSRYVADRIPRLKLKTAMQALTASLLVPGTTVAVTMPYLNGAEIRNFGKGVVLSNNHPEWKQCEHAILRSSGSFEFRRILPENYNEQNILNPLEPRLALVGTVIDLTLAVSMLARLAHELGKPDEMIELSIALSGLLNRKIDDDSMRYGARVPLSLTVGTGHPSLESEVSVKRNMTIGELEATSRELAVEMSQEILWTFGLEPSTATVAGWQEPLRDKSEPLALEPG